MSSLIRCFALCMAIVVAPVAIAAEYDIQTTGRVVAFSDVHGAYEDLVQLLQELDVIDADGNWIAGDTHLVSTGDLLDRGPRSRDVMDLLIKLEQQAAKAGGALHLTLGNHEVMVMTGDLRYVSKEEYAAFAADEKQADRESLFEEYLQFNPELDQSEARETFDQQYPPGFIAMRKAFASDGKYGAWLTGKPFVIKVNDKVYMHGGISAQASEMSLQDLNKTLSEQLLNLMDNMSELREAGVMPWFVSYHDRLNFINDRVTEYSEKNPRSRATWFGEAKRAFDAQEDLVFDTDSPVWYRGTASCHPLSESFNTERFLNKVAAKQLVVGHTPTHGDVESRMDGLVIRLDTGMLHSVYKGRASALVSHNGKDYVHYLGDEQKMLPTVESDSLALKLSSMNDVDMEDFLRTAAIINVEDIGTGVTKPKRVTQQRGDIIHDAAFKYEDSTPGLESRKRYIYRKDNDSDRYQYDVAAYKLDRMLDWQMVPTAVIREVEGREGALSDWVENSINERDRLEEDISFDSYCKQWEQYRLRFVFDILIYNEDRNLTNILWSKDDFMMRFIDHSLAFRTKTDRPKQYRKVDLEVSNLLRGRLERLNQDNLQQELSPYLHPEQIEALLERRDLILKEAVKP